jgi:flavin reductase (DIM6/NTAB) family NADH-FMN oxidoreductase RutF
VVAVTTSAGGHRNGFIVNSAQRASLLPAYPRISFYCSKPNFSHDLILSSGVFTIHLLGRDQWSTIMRLGLESGRDRDKLEGMDWRAGATGCPVLVECVAAFECRVVNTMDAGAATFLLGDVVATHAGQQADEVMDSPYFRAHMPAELRRRYEANLAVALELLGPLAGTIDTDARWSGAGRSA